MSTAPELIQQGRGSWTSASNALADSLCPGRHLAQRGIPDEPGKYADTGRKIHAALAAIAYGPNNEQSDHRAAMANLSVEEQQTFAACQEIRQKVILQYFGQIESKYTEFREQRFWARFKLNGTEFQHSGQADFIGRQGTKTLIVDYKTLPGEVAESPKNMQLRDLACLAYGNLIPTTEIAVAIIQPFVTRQPVLCVYTKAELDRATKDMFDRVVRSNTLEAERVAGEVQCKYCKARRTCTVYQKWAGEIAPPAMLGLLEIPMASWTPEQMGRAANALAPLEKFLAEVKAEIKARLEKDKGAVVGWELKPGALRETIINPQGVFERFAKLGGTVEQFMPAVDIGKAKLREAVAKLTGARGKNLEGGMQILLEGLTESKPTAPTLKRSDPAPEVAP